MGKSTEVKQRIIQATIALIQESNGNVAEITTRDIAQKAEVGNGLINYHFQTKENLITICVQQMIGQVVSGFKPLMEVDKTNMEHLIVSATQVFTFLFQNSAVSRISILGDYSNYFVGNNSDNTQKGFMHIMGDEMSNNDNRFLAFTLVSTMQAAFLSQSIIKDFLGYDFSVGEDRENFITKLVTMLYDGIRKEERSEKL